MMSAYYQRGQGWKEKWKGWNENETTMKYHDQKDYNKSNKEKNAP